MNSKHEEFMERKIPEEPRPNDWRSPYSRDKARIIHGSGFRRLQGKTQVMGAGEGDFHRTRLTHSIEVNQIGLGLFEGIKKRDDIKIPELLVPFLKNGHPVVSAACYGHDLGHPPFGHGGERALHIKMKNNGGFEGNAQTIRLMAKLEKYYEHKGINPTRRVLLSLLKYPVDFVDYPQSDQKKNKPPKCYYDCEKEMVDWCLEKFSSNDKNIFKELKEVGPGKIKPVHMSFDASIMECADDIAYCTHDLEDIVARGLVTREMLMDKVSDFCKNKENFKDCEVYITEKDFEELFKGSHSRKQTIGKFVNLLMTNTVIVENGSFEHPLLRFRLSISENLKRLTNFLRDEVTYQMVVEKPEIQMLERKGQRVINSLFKEFILAPEILIPHWDKMDQTDSKERRVCDYIAGMTDSFAAKIYHRLFTPGIGSSRDEL
ncbi:deoxyguanosinetriphosphate triphosphohydrolase-like protein 2 [Desulfosarcina ovata subsp. sediminis]|uniref:Deoxyguanosinetriphosphate triphosphohydrolase-like protein 2 n=2 Tax=Desulfosarcina ovata TaxID=83564 RepID=A0A5K8A0R1_9BACT|nr:deoxyguanosinetriphosphate triphosphohydrolase-like protein 2 [Desulfosarcina ovata subsp. sediminis]